MFTPESISIFFKSITEGLFISFNEEQSMRAPLSICFTEGGIDICKRDEHPKNAFSLIVVNEEGFSKVISSSDMHSKKASFSIIVTELGITIFFKAEHSANDPFLINFTEVGILTSVNDRHLTNT